jgi:hypothetical protein
LPKFVDYLFFLYEEKNGYRGDLRNISFISLYSVRDFLLSALHSNLRTVLIYNT